MSAFHFGGKQIPIQPILQLIQMTDKQVLGKGGEMLGQHYIIIAWQNNKGYMQMWCTWPLCSFSEVFPQLTLDRLFLISSTYSLTSNKSKKASIFKFFRWELTLPWMGGWDEHKMPEEPLSSLIKVIEKSLELLLHWWKFNERKNFLFEQDAATGIGLFLFNSKTLVLGFIAYRKIQLKVQIYPQPRSSKNSKTSKSSPMVLICHYTIWALGKKELVQAHLI